MKNQNKISKNTPVQKNKMRKVRKYCKSAVSLLFTFAYALAMSVNAFADGLSAPSGVDTSTMSSFVSLVLWIVRVGIAVIAVPGILKIVQGQADENPRDRNAGITTVAIAGACFAATFAVPSILGI